jgi:hypothetical protein
MTCSAPVLVHRSARSERCEPGRLARRQFPARLHSVTTAAAADPRRAPRDQERSRCPVPRDRLVPSRNAAPVIVAGCPPVSGLVRSRHHEPTKRPKSMSLPAYSAAGPVTWSASISPAPRWVTSVLLVTGCAPRGALERAWSNSDHRSAGSSGKTARDVHDSPEREPGPGRARARAHAGPVARLASAAASAAGRTDLPAGPARSGATRPGPAADGTA